MINQISPFISISQKEYKQLFISSHFISKFFLSPKKMNLQALNQSGETLSQIDQKLKSDYFCYNLWLNLMLLVSGIFLFCVAAAFVASFNYGPRSFLAQLVLLALNLLVFAQFLIEKWAITTKDLSAANLALYIITITTFISLGLTALSGYSTYKFYENMPEPSESTSFTKGMLGLCLIGTSLFSLTHVFITQIQAVKVRNDLQIREMAQVNIEATLNLLPSSQ